LITIPLAIIALIIGQIATVLGAAFLSGKLVSRLEITVQQVEALKVSSVDHGDLVDVKERVKELEKGRDSLTALQVRSESLSKLCDQIEALREDMRTSQSELSNQIERRLQSVQEAVSAMSGRLVEQEFRLRNVEKASGVSSTNMRKQP